MRWRTLGPIQLLLVLVAHLCVSPLNIAYARWPTSSRPAASYQSPSSLGDTLPFSIQEKVRLKNFPIVLARTDVLTAESIRPDYLERPLAVQPNFVRLTGFQLRVSERPPPSYV